MSELAELISQRDNLLAQIKELEEFCGDANVDKILDAIKIQRWYFFKDYTEFFMDKFSGILWANLDYFTAWENSRSNSSIGRAFNLNSGVFYDTEADALNAIKNFFKSDDWRLPTYDELVKLIVVDNSFPFHEGNSRLIKGKTIWLCSDGSIDDTVLRRYKNWGFLFPCSSAAVNKSGNPNYSKNVALDNKIYSERERLKFTLDLFVKNNLWPVFNDDKITQLYGKIYIDIPQEMPKLTSQLQEVQAKIKELQAAQEKTKALQAVKVSSSEFDYKAMLAKYNLDEINSSLIKYFQALQTWTDELMNKLETYEREKEAVIQQFNAINFKLSKKYEDSPDLTTDENNYLRERQEFFSKNLSLEMHAAKSKILAIRKQADDIESTLDEIDSGENSLAALAKLEQTPRASFSLVAENTARIIRNALLKIEYFEGNKNFVVNAIDILVSWTENFRVFSTTKTAELKRSCNDDSIDEEICGEWISDWAALRFEIEKKLQPIIERGLKNNFPTEKIIAVLDEYKNSVDKFFLEERKGIYQKFAFIPSGELQEKLETESELYKLTSQFQTGLQKIIFDCARSDDRIFILSWAGNLLDIQIDEIINFAADKEISGDILAEFSQLKQKNFDAYLADAQAYSEEKSRREKQYNSLIFKMRKDLAAK